MKKLVAMVATSVATLLLASCAGGAKQPADNYEILGSTDQFDGMPVVLRQGNVEIARDTVREGKFRMTGYVDTVHLVIMEVPEKVGYQFFLEPGTITTVLENREGKGTPYNDALNKYYDDINAIVKQMYLPNANTDSLGMEYDKVDKPFRQAHAGDPIGLYFLERSAYALSLEQIDSLFALYPLYRQSRVLNSQRANKLKEQATSPGALFIDFEGVDLATGKAMKLSDVVGKGRPVLIDFWASWCGPCRMEIKTHLSKIAPQYAGKVDVLGVAVWEKSVDDTQKAMKELPISWSVMFAGSRENSPTEAYGISGIPEIMLVDGEGIIRARGLRGDQIVSAIEKLLAK